jgi:hypothetical protein
MGLYTGYKKFTFYKISTSLSRNIVCKSVITYVSIVLKFEVISGKYNIGIIKLSYT